MRVSRSTPVATLFREQRWEAVAAASDPSAADLAAWYRRGVAFLMRTREADGSWHVRSRAFGFQPYFESGFPHGHDPWISIAATAWAVIALMPAVEPADIAAR